MKIYEVLTQSKHEIETIISAGVNPKDVRYLEMYRDYLRLKNEGLKTTYIEAHLCDEYDVKQWKFYEIIKLFGIDI